MTRAHSDAATGGKVIDLMEALKASLAGERESRIGEVLVAGDRGARFQIEKNDPDRLVIRDLGPWDEHPSITNDAEHVVSTLAATLAGRRLFYYDSNGDLDELLVDSVGAFAGFAPGPR